VKPALVLSLLLLAGCVSDPRLNAGISLGTGGLSVYPSVSGRVGPARVAISP
jgi:hypothetical protein